ncbi:class I SAM-dependent methyltransferase [Planococcus chinensis]|uniref:class I SAM-dependent methyltransferase n=1 Tax=Planococcus chinensis TaxID=272917 RepID=UPI001CC817A8|nr:methyltransferase domain-containing protein [Planococcus chinensis]
MEQLLAAMKILGDDTIQRTQLKHRMNLVKAFGIQDGMSVIEVGCGQGDTTVALANGVGESGRVLAVDIAPPDYGAPITLGEATSSIAASPLGSRVEFRLETDLLDLPEGRFDVAVLSHCSWYFRDPDQLLMIFKKLRRMAKRICVAEWDVNFTQLSQRSHFTAAAILALYSEFVENDGNIQHLFDSHQLQHLLEEAGWNVAETATVAASYLQDGSWEADYARSVQQAFSTAPPRIRSLAGSFYSLLEKENIASLDSVVILAE